MANDQVNEVRQATDIIRLISEQVALKARGKEFVGLCPFHSDKNPSLNVSPSKQIYKCYACSAGGSVFDFVMNYHKMTFPEALQYLAERASIKLERFSSKDKTEGPSDRQRIGDANGKAVAFFRTLYFHKEHGKLAREYVAKRHISDEMVEAFQLGYAPDRWDGLALMIAKENWDLKAFEMAGLVNSRSNGPGHYDRLRHRLIFPIFDAIGRPIAFGGRKMREEDEPKYLNSPETALFNKSGTLYGLHLAKKPIIDSKTAVIVEGYTDVIACHQAGIRNVVATLGTALTAQHIATLRHYCDKVVLVYDGDEAGQKASDRAVEVFLTGDMDVYIAILPDELDPAELFEESDGVARWESAISKAKDALDHQFRRIASQVRDSGTVTGKQTVLNEYFASLTRHGFEKLLPVRRAIIVKRLAELLDVDVMSVHAMIQAAGQTRAGKPYQPPAPAAPPAPTPQVRNPEAGTNQGSSESDHGQDGDWDGPGGPSDSYSKTPPTPPAVVPENIKTAQRWVIGCLLCDPSLFHDLSLEETLLPDEFSSSLEKELYGLLLSRMANGESIELGTLVSELAASDRKDLRRLIVDAESEVDIASNGNRELIRKRMEQCLAKIRAHGDVKLKGEIRSGQGGTKDDVEVATRLAQFAKERPSPIRIARTQENSQTPPPRKPGGTGDDGSDRKHAM